MDPDEFQNVTKMSGVQSYGCGKIFMKIRSVFPDISATLLQNALSRNVNESFKGVLDLDPAAADEFQNLTSSSPNWYYLRSNVFHVRSRDPDPPPNFKHLCLKFGGEDRC